MKKLRISPTGYCKEILLGADQHDAIVVKLEVKSVWNAETLPVERPLSLSGVAYDCELVTRQQGEVFARQCLMCGEDWHEAVKDHKTTSSQRAWIQREVRRGWKQVITVNGELGTVLKVKQNLYALPSFDCTPPLLGAEEIAVERPIIDAADAKELKKLWAKYRGMDVGSLPPLVLPKIRAIFDKYPRFDPTQLNKLRTSSTRRAGRDLRNLESKPKQHEKCDYGSECDEQPCWQITWRQGGQKKIRFSCETHRGDLIHQAEQERDQTSKIVATEYD